MCVLFNLTQEVFHALCSRARIGHTNIPYSHNNNWRTTWNSPAHASYPKHTAVGARAPGDPTSRNAVELRKRIATGDRSALEEQYLDGAPSTHLKHVSMETQPLQTAYVFFC